MARSVLLQSVLLLLTGFELAQPELVGFAANRAISLPRYRLEVNQELTYSGHSRSRFKDFDNHDGCLEFHNEWKAWVVRKNDDGSHRVVISYKEFARRDGKESGGPRLYLAYCEVGDDGKVVSNLSLGFNDDIAAPFRRLPADEKELAGGWANLSTYHGRSAFSVVRAPETASDVWKFQELLKDPMNEVLLKTHKSLVTFDPKRGLVTQIDDEDTDGWAFRGKGTGTIELVSVEKRDPAWISKIWADTGCYLATKRVYDEKLRQASKDIKLSKARLAEAQSLWATAKGIVTVPFAKDVVEFQLNAHARQAEICLDEASRRAKIVGHPAPDFEAVDLNGESHSLKDYRGKIVVLDFWSRGCGMCTIAMPQIKQLAADFRGKPLVVLGMNTGPESDARFAADKLGLEFATLAINRELLEEYGVRGWPTFVIIDQRGYVRDMVFRYSPTLERHISKIVRGLFAKGELE